MIPVLNEAASIGKTLDALLATLDCGSGIHHEIIVVDGHSDDATVAQVGTRAHRVVTASRGRANQMRRGAEVATGDVLVFLHADTLLPHGGLSAVRAAIAAGHDWGRFDVTLSGRRVAFRVIERMISLRSRLCGIATGDQAMFMTTRAYEAVGGFPRLRLMEDVEMSKRLRQLSAPACLRQRVTTSSRRWEERGIVRTVLTMWALRAAYALGVSADRLVNFYRRG